MHDVLTLPMLGRAGCAVSLLVLLLAGLPAKADEPGEEAAGLAAPTSGALAFAEQPAELPAAWDPGEPINRALFGLNRGLDFLVVRPFAFLWSQLKPVYVPQATSNFYQNIAIIRNLTSNMLQGEGRRAGTEGQRFLINTTIGRLGIWDPATHWFDIEPERANYDQTFGKWGMGPGPAIEIPVVGATMGQPTSGRGLLALPFDLILGLQLPPYVPSLNQQALLREQRKVAREADDPWVFRRDSYAAWRRAMVER